MRTRISYFVKAILTIVVLLSQLNCIAQFSCPDSLVYGVSTVFSPFIRVYNPKLPVSATNPSNTAIPVPIPVGLHTGLALCKNFNATSPSPTLYSFLPSGNYCYWNGTSWIDTGHIGNFQAAIGDNGSAAGCNSYIFSVNANTLTIQSFTVYRYNGAGSAVPILTLTTNTKFIHDIVVDCNCNFYILSQTEFKKYSSVGILLNTYTVTGLPGPFDGSSLAMIGNKLYTMLYSNGLYTGTINGSTLAFSFTGNGNFGASDMATCATSTIVSTVAGINSGSIGCNPAAVNLVATSTLNPVNYTWSGPSIGSAVTAGSQVSVNAAGIYTCVLTQNTCDYVLSTLVTTVTSNTVMPPAQILPANQLCLAPFTQLFSSINSGPYSYQWASAAMPNGATTPSLAITVAGIYSLTVTNQNNGCSSAVTASVLTAPLLSIGISSPTLCISSTNGKDKAVLTYSGANTYTLLVSSGFSVQLQASQPVVLSQTQPPQLGGASGSATLIGSNGVCTGSVLTNFTVLPITNLISTPQNTSVCKDATITLAASGAISYTWLPADKVQSVNQNSAQVNVNTTTAFTVVGSDANGCMTTRNQILIAVLPPHDGELLYPPLICAGACARFTFDAVPELNNKVSSVWVVNKTTYLQGNTFTYCFAKADDYIFVGTLKDSAHSCSNAVTYTISVREKPNASFVAQPLAPIENLDEVLFTNTSSGATKWRWTVKEDKTYSSADENFNHLYSKPGVYPIALEVSNDWGCKDTAIKAITVLEDFSFYVPNTFTPNNDSKNDNFQPVVRSFRLYSLKIYDRWGQEIFYSLSPQSGWDGSYKGVPCKQDIYTWAIELTTNAGERITKTGFVTLIR